MLKYDVYDYQENEVKIDIQLVNESIDLICDFYENKPLYNLKEYKYELNVLLFDNSRQGKKYSPK